MALETTNAEALGLPLGTHHVECSGGNLPVSFHKAGALLPIHITKSMQSIPDGQQVTKTETTKSTVTRREGSSQYLICMF